MTDKPAGVPPLESAPVVSLIKETFAPDGAAEREHNALEGSLGFGAIHYSLIVNLKPERVLVIGSRHGYVPAIIAHALRFNGRGTMDFVDANYSDAEHGFGAAYGGVGNWTEPGIGRFASFDVGDRMRVHVMRSAEFFAGCEAFFQYAYLDGDHSYEGCRFDFEATAARVEDGGLIVLHDVSVTDPFFGVRHVFDELDERRYGKLVVPAWPGLAIVQVRKGNGLM
jgi:predicted O-methyltransferase YrrM